MELVGLKEYPAEMNDPSRKHADRLKKRSRAWGQYKTDNGVLDIWFDLSVVN
jgi:hypothetical protein